MNEEKQMTVNEAIEILERDDEDMRRGFFCLNYFTAIEVLERFAKACLNSLSVDLRGLKL